MNNELADISKLSKEEIMELTGQSTGYAEDGLPQLRINREDQDGEGRDLPIGSFYIRFNGENVYAKAARFRPFINSYQYSVYNEKENKYTNRSIVFKSWQDEAIDAQGGVKCGKVAKKYLDQLTPDQKEVQSRIKCHRLLYGLVSMKGVTAGNKEVVVEDFPVLWRSTGVHWMPIDEALESLTKRKYLMYNYWFDLGLKREKKGSNTYFTTVILPDTTKQVPFAEKEWETMKVFLASIDSINKDIVESHRVANKNKPQIGDEVGEQFDASKALDAQFTEVSPLNSPLNYNDSLEGVGTT